MAETVIELRQVHKSYGRSLVLKGVDMRVERGDLYGLIGKNGAGKTTLFKVILGLTRYQGQLSILGGHSEAENLRNRSRIGFSVGPCFYPAMSGRENLAYYCRMKGIADRKEPDRVLEMVGLSRSAGAKAVRGYSMGMRQRLELANALLGSPEILILDEPINGLDPQGIADIRNLLIDLNREGRTLLVSSHILAELEHTARRFGIVNQGVLVRELDSEELARATGLTALTVADSDAERAKALLESQGIAVTGMRRAGESLEEYYFNLVGDEKKGGAGHA